MKLQEARRRSAQILALHVATYNSAACELYHRFGFQRLRKHLKFYHLNVGRAPGPNKQTLYDGYLYALPLVDTGARPGPLPLQRDGVLLQTLAGGFEAVRTFFQAWYDMLMHSNSPCDSLPLTALSKEGVSEAHHAVNSDCNAYGGWLAPGSTASTTEPLMQRRPDSQLYASPNFAAHRPVALGSIRGGALHQQLAVKVDQCNRLRADEGKMEALSCPGINGVMLQRYDKVEKGAQTTPPPQIGDGNLFCEGMRETASQRAVGLMQDIVGSSRMDLMGEVASQRGLTVARCASLQQASSQLEGGPGKGEGYGFAVLGPHSVCADPAAGAGSEDSGMCAGWRGDAMCTGHVRGSTCESLRVQQQGQRFWAAEELTSASTHRWHDPMLSPPSDTARVAPVMRQAAQDTDLVLHDCCRSLREHCPTNDGTWMQDVQDTAGSEKGAVLSASIEADSVRRHTALDNVCWQRSDSTEQHCGCTSKSTSQQAMQVSMQGGGGGLQGASITAEAMLVRPTGFLLQEGRWMQHSSNDKLTRVPKPLMAGSRESYEEKSEQIHTKFPCEVPHDHVPAFRECHPDRDTVEIAPWEGRMEIYRWLFRRPAK
jgi:hypothetical protein